MFRLIASKAVPFDLPTVGIFALGAAGTYAVGSVMQSVATRWAGELVD
ncbi:MAG: hypothetical protein IT371_16610 [Deltaproteobacteria bacterium]|nr:hypothetical protein [Deltaproteobacteria bacterium]